ncbi:MAG: hypothetical protein HY644_04310 [Acidobacteria bacterium]|nr:hypothetical protein [Acidobacteriota bacterium]
MDPATVVVIILAVAFVSFVAYLVVISRRNKHERTGTEGRSNNQAKKR